MNNFNDRYSQGIQAQLAQIRARQNAKYETELLQKYQSQNQANFDYLNKTLKDQNESSSRASIFTAGTTAAQLGYKLNKYAKKKKLEARKKASQKQTGEDDEMKANENEELNPEDDAFLQEEFKGVNEEDPRIPDYDDEGIELQPFRRAAEQQVDEPQVDEPEVPEVDEPKVPASRQPDEDDFELPEEEDYPIDTIGDNPFEEADFNQFLKTDYVGSAREQAGLDPEGFDPYANLPTGEATRIQTGSKPLFGAEEGTEYLEDTRPITSKISNVKDWFQDKIDSVKNLFDNKADPFEQIERDRIADRNADFDYSNAAKERLFGGSPKASREPEPEPEEQVEAPKEPPEAEVIGSETLPDEEPMVGDEPEIEYVTKSGYNIPKFGEEEDDAASGFTETAQKALKRASTKQEEGVEDVEAGEGEMADLEEAGTLEGLETADLALGETTAATAAIPIVGEVVGAAAGVAGIATLGYGAYKYVSDHPHMISKLGSDVGDFFTGKFSQMTNPFSDDPPPTPLPKQTQPNTNQNISQGVVNLGQSGPQYT